MMAYVFKSIVFEIARWCFHAYIICVVAMGWKVPGLAASCGVQGEGVTGEP